LRIQEKNFKTVIFFNEPTGGEMATQRYIQSNAAEAEK
jgi:hypothetical protein